MPVSDWFDMMTQTLSVEPPATRDRYSDQTYGSAVTYRCRLVGKRRLVTNALGQDVVSSMTAYLGTAAVVDPQSRITLSTADVGSTEDGAIHPSVIDTGRYPDENGPHHSVVYFK